MLRWTVTLWTLAMYVTAAHALDAPKPSAPPADQAPAEVAAFTPTDERAFVAVLQRSTHHRNLTGLKVEPDIVTLLARGDVASVVAQLSEQSTRGSNDASIALVRIQHWCSRIASVRMADAQAQIAQLPPLSANRGARAAGVLLAEQTYRQIARDGCARAQFDYRGIEGRLRDAAEAGDPASATELALFVRDPARQQTMLQAAADKGFAPAQYVLATRRLVAVQRGETTENVASIRLLLKQAGRSINKAKVDLANCMALGCDGHPADAAGAAAFGMDAARDGEPSAFLSMARMPWGVRIDRAQLLAWQYFGDRLSEAGCGGESYVTSTIAFDQTIQALERKQDTQFLERARSQADSLWRDNGERARREQGCAQ